MVEPSYISIGPRIHTVHSAGVGGGSARTKHACGAGAPARHVYAHLVAKFTTTLNKGADLAEIGNV